MTDIDEDRVRRIAEEARRFLEPRWHAWRERSEKALRSGVPISDNMCRFSTRFLKLALHREMPEGQWLHVGGTPEQGHEDVDPDYGFSGGYRDQQGEWHAHYWVTDGGYGLIVDVTADQFGGEAVTVVADEVDFVGGTVIHRFPFRENYREEAVHDHMDDVAYSVSLWLEDWDSEHPAGWSMEVDQRPDFGM